MRQVNRKTDSKSKKESAREEIEVMDLLEPRLEDLNQVTTAQAASKIESKVPEKKKFSILLHEKFGLSDLILAPGTFITRKPSGSLKDLFDDKTK